MDGWTEGICLPCSFNVLYNIEEIGWVVNIL